MQVVLIKFTADGISLYDIQYTMYSDFITSIGDKVDYHERNIDKRAIQVDINCIKNTSGIQISNS